MRLRALPSFADGHAPLRRAVPPLSLRFYTVFAQSFPVTCNRSTDQKFVQKLCQQNLLILGQLLSGIPQDSFLYTGDVLQVGIRNKTPNSAPEKCEEREGWPWICTVVVLSSLTSCMFRQIAPTAASDHSGARDSPMCIDYKHLCLMNGQ